MKQANTDLVSELNRIIEQGLENTPLPYKKGNSIRIGKYAVRKNNKGIFLVYDCSTNLQVAKTYFKITAIAIAKNLAANKNITNRALQLDFDLLKHFNDALFFKNIIRTSKDPEIVSIRRIRLDIALTKTQQLKKDLDRFVF
jgi:hypothetical protein